MFIIRCRQVNPNIGLLDLVGCYIRVGLLFIVIFFLLSYKYI